MSRTELRVSWSPDRSRLEAFLRRDTGLFLYHLGDLDPFYAPNVRWACIERVAGREVSIEAVILLYDAVDPPVLLALEERSPESLVALLRAVWPALPRRVFAHVSSRVTSLLPPCEVDFHGGYQKMIREGEGVPRRGDAAFGDVRVLDEGDLPAIVALLDCASPGHAFEPRSLAHGATVGVLEGEALVAMAGVHVVSSELGVAALGNVATRPDRRGRGLGTLVTEEAARLLERLVRDIGLNVRRDNVAAIRCYERVGFRKVADYDELTLTLLPSRGREQPELGGAG